MLNKAVDWKFLMSEGELTQAQLTSLQQSMGDELATIGNFRPPQPLNGRMVDGCSYCPWYPYSAANWSTCAKGKDAVLACNRGQGKYSTAAAVLKNTSEINCL